MNVIILVLAMGIFSFSSFANAKSSSSGSSDSYTSAGKRHGVGIALGYPGAITYFQQLHDRAMIQLFANRFLVVGGDYGILFPNAIDGLLEVTPFVGGGAFVFDNYPIYNVSTGVGIGGRIPLGLLWTLPKAPIQFHVEVTPSVVILPSIVTFLDAMVGVRFLF